MKRIVVTGGYSSSNKGEAAMLITAAQELRRQLGEVEITALCPFPEVDRLAYEPYGVRVVPSNRRKLGRSLLQMAAGGKRTNGFIDSAEVHEAASADLVIDLSGDGLTEDYGPHVVLSHLYPLMMAQELGRPTMVCAQSIGPFRWTTPLVRRVLDGAACITPRDQPTADRLRAMGVKSRIEVTADLAHLLQPAPDEDIAPWLDRAPPRFWERPVLGVTISRLLGNRQSVERPGQPSPTVEIYRQTLRVLQARHGFNVLLVSHSTGPRPARDDRIITRQLADALGDPSGVYLIDDDLSAPRLKALIGRCQLFCALRMHSAIAALSSGVPTVVVGYGPKALGLMSALQQEEMLISMADAVRPGRLEERLEAAWQRRDAARATLAAHHPAIRERSRENIRIAASLLD